jgi:hypothetical protein
MKNMYGISTKIYQVGSDIFANTSVIEEDENDNMEIIIDTKRIQ